MSMRLEMLQVARLAPRILGDSADLVRDFLRRQQNEDGGFKDRSGQSDLYYTVFGIDALVALQAELPVERIAGFLRRFDDGEQLDLVHLCCLARCRGALAAAQGKLPGSSISFPPSQLLQRIEAFRSRDGGYNPAPRSEFGTAYACFLALGAYQDLHTAMPEPLRVVQCLKFLETDDGAWANERAEHRTGGTGDKWQVASGKGRPGFATGAVGVLPDAGSTNATAAAATLLRNLGMPVNPAAGAWLLARSHPQGGFLAAPKAPLADLLSTATALHALAGMEVSFQHLKEQCLDFVDSLWTNEGSFHGHWSDDALDCEYTFYGLLALGHLSL